MQGINIYEQPAVIEIAVEPANRKNKIEENQLVALHQLFQTDFSLNHTPVRAVKFTNQFIDSRWAFLFGQDEKYILQSAYLKPGTLISQIVEKRSSEVTKLDPNFVYFMAYNHDYANYYHWTIQCLPALSIFISIKNLYSNLKVLLPSNLPDFALQYLKLINIDLEREVEFLPVQGSLFFAENVLYPSLLGGEFSYNTSQAVLNFTEGLFTRQFKSKSNAANLFNKSKKRVLYCSRLDSGNRKIINEQELIDTLKSKFKAKVVANSGQTVKDQAKVFYDSDIIISPHGAGLSNLVYCQSKTTIIELLPDKYLNPCFATLAVNKGCEYYPLVSPTIASEGHQHAYEWQVNIDSIEAILTSIN